MFSNISAVLWCFFFAKSYWVFPSIEAHDGLLLPSGTSEDLGKAEGTRFAGLPLAPKVHSRRVMDFLGDPDI